MRQNMNFIGRYIVTMVFLFTTAAAFADNVFDLSIYNNVPLAESITPGKGGGFTITSKTDICYSSADADMKRNAEMLSQYIHEACGISLTVEEGKRKGCIELALNKKISGDEEYRITVKESSVVIEGKTPRGVFYGIQCLRKAVIAAPRPIVLPPVTICDSPRFSYRGMHLDVARHFFSVEFVKKYIDILALHNINTFHWHLTDDQGWRLEIKAFPELTTIGAYRDQTVIGRNSPLCDGIRYGGFYTQEEAREIVRYAADRYITVIPEIDMPGHMLAALTAYPQLGCTGGPYHVEGTWGVFPDILCAGKEETYRFVEKVLDEVMEIFPSDYIHIGGDEAPRDRWRECPLCQKVISDNHLTANGNHPAEAALQAFFTERIEKYINIRGRRIIGWDELLEGNVNESATIMSWRGTEGGLYAAQHGHDVIMTPVSHCYFDYYQTDKTWNEPLCIGNFLPIEKVYSLDPAPDELGDAKSHILGAQANLWSEYLTCENLAEYQLMPRIAALSEVAWTQTDRKNFDEFSTVRLPKIKKIYDLYGLTYFK